MCISLSLSLSLSQRQIKKWNWCSEQSKKKEQRRARNGVELGQGGYILHTLRDLQVFFF